MAIASGAVTYPSLDRPAGKLAGFFYVLFWLAENDLLRSMDYSLYQSGASSKRGTGGFAVGFGVKYQKDLAFNEYAQEVYTKGAKALFMEQLEVSHYYLNRRSGGLETHLASFPYSISMSSGNLLLELNYQLKVRFLDLKKTRRGKPKRYYEPIYNRLVWGFVFGRIYKALRFGFTEAVRQKYTDKLRESYNISTDGLQ